MYEELGLGFFPVHRLRKRMVSVENSSTDPNLFLTNRLGDIRAYSSSLASFTLQWRDLEELFESIQLSVDDCFNAIQLRQKQITEALSSSVPSQPRPELKYLCLNMDGKGLRSFLIEKTKARPPFSIGDEVSAALLSAPDPAMLVLDAVDGFYPRKSKSKGKDKHSELADIRRTCVLLLEQLMKISPRIGPAVTAKAKKLAIEWKAKINGENDNSSRVLGLLLLLAAYELGCVFQLNVLFDLFEMVALHHQASELYRRLGLMDRVSGKLGHIGHRYSARTTKFGLVLYTVLCPGCTFCLHAPFVMYECFICESQVEF